MPYAGLSYWERESLLSCPDFTIVGSGLVGLCAALHLRERRPHARILILEKGMMPTGASTRNAGFACFGSLSELMDDLRNMPLEDVLALVEERWLGLRQLKSLTGDSLRFQPCGGYELFFAKDEALYRDCLEQLAFFNERLSGIMGLPEVYGPADGDIARLGFKGVRHLIINNAEGHIDTGGMVAKLLAIAKEKDIRILNGAEVLHWEEGTYGVRLELSDGRELQTAKILWSTNGFARRHFPDMDISPARNQVLITHPIPNLKPIGTFHFDAGFYYFRNVGNRLLFGGGRNLMPERERTEVFGTTLPIRSALLYLLREHLIPDTPFEVDMWWSGILGVGNTKRPIIEKIGRNSAVAIRMGGMGIAIGSRVGARGAEKLLE